MHKIDTGDEDAVAWAGTFYRGLQAKYGATKIGIMVNQGGAITTEQRQVIEDAFVREVVGPALAEIPEEYGRKVAELIDRHRGVCNG